MSARPHTTLPRGRAVRCRLDSPAAENRRQYFPRVVHISVPDFVALEPKTILASARHIRQPHRARAALKARVALAPLHRLLGLCVRKRYRLLTPRTDYPTRAR